jgi:hypothetical protein
LLSHQPFEPSILFFERFQARRLASLQPPVLLFPSVEGLLANTVLPAQCRRRRTRFMLLHDANDLFLRKPAPTHAVLLGALSQP